VGVTGYEVYLDGVLVTTVATTSYTFKGLTDSTTYSITLKAKDAAGNVSTSSVAVSVKTLDGKAPSIPLNLKVTNLTSVGFTISWSASNDNVGVTGYEIYRDGKLVSTVNGTNYVFTGLKDDRTYSITIKAKDAAGNRSGSSQVLSIKTLDSTAPTIPSKLTFSAITGTALTLNWKTSTDNVGVTEYQVYRNGKIVGTSKSTSYRVSGLNENVTQLFTVRAVDAAGNQSGLSLPVRTQQAIKLIGQQLYVNFKLINWDAGVTLLQSAGQTIVPFKPFLKALGLYVNYDVASKMITATKTGMIIKFTPSKTKVIVNGINKTMPVAAKVVKGRTFIPLNFFAKELGYQLTITK
jgi:chitodextrinase